MSILAAAILGQRLLPFLVYTVIAIEPLDLNAFSELAELARYIPGVLWRGSGSADSHTPHAVRSQHGWIGQRRASIADEPNEHGVCRCDDLSDGLLIRFGVKVAEGLAGDACDDGQHRLGEAPLVPGGELAVGFLRDCDQGTTSNG